MMRKVHLGTKPVEGSKGVATHWAIGLGDGPDLLWLEVDGNAGGEKEKSFGCPNTINGYDASWWTCRKGPEPIMYRGHSARSGAVRCKEVGTTSKSDKEIQEFNATYLSQNPTYNLVKANCQDYALELVKWLVGSVADLPSREKFVYGGAAAAGSVGILGALGAWWMMSQRGEKEKDEDNKKKEGSESCPVEAR